MKDPVLAGTDAVWERRQQMYARGNCCLLDPQEFVHLATSRESYVRADDPEAALSGLMDIGTGMLLFVENEKLGQAAAYSVSIGEDTSCHHRIAAGVAGN